MVKTGHTFLQRTATLFAILFLLAAVLVRVIFSPLPTQLDFYPFVASRYPEWIGMTPAFLYGVKPGYSFEQLYQKDLTGKEALVTGANSGIGYEISLSLARLGSYVTLACRNESRCNDAVNKIRADEMVQTQTLVNTMIVDFSDLKSVKDFSKQFRAQANKLDMLFMNAGIGTAGVNDDGSVPLSVDRIEKVFATNLVGHHLMYKWLESLLKSARIVLTSSSASFGATEARDCKIETDLDTLNSVQFKDSNRVCPYARTKLGQIYWAQELTKQLRADSRVYEILRETQYRM
jgi:NAD(P)-dependent dehydrogenase (short-subunit alcohol dehydrogenase family)